MRPPDIALGGFLINIWVAVEIRIRVAVTVKVGPGVCARRIIHDRLNVVVHLLARVCKILKLAQQLFAFQTFRIERRIFAHLPTKRVLTGALLCI